MDSASRGATRAVNSRLVLAGVACLTFALSLVTWAVASDTRKLRLGEVDPPAAEPPSWLRDYVSAPPGVQAGIEAESSADSKEGEVSPAELESSRDAFRGLDGAEAAEIAARKFPELITEPLDPAPKLAEGESIVSYPTANSARLELPGGEHAVVESLLPLVTTNAEGEQVPIDLSMSANGDVLTTASPLVPVRIGTQLAEGFALPGLGLTITPTDSSGAALQGTGEITGAVAHFANTQADTDTIVKPLPLGLQTHSILRSPASPEQLYFRVEVEGDEGPTLTRLEDGSVLVEDGGKPVTVIPPPLAQDAAGAPVPVSMAIEDGLLALAVEHRSEEYLYPIDVDPTVADADSFTEGEGQHNWVYSTNAPSVFEGVWNKTFDKLTIDNGEYPYKTNSYVYGNYGSWFYLTQGSSRIYEVDIHGNGSSSAALAFLSIVGPGGEEGKTWVPETYVSEAHQVCATESCASSAGSANNATVFELSAIEDNNTYVDAALNSASVKIVQDQGASVSFDTTSPEIEGKPNALYKGGQWVKASDQAWIKFSASDPGIGLNYASLSSPGYGSWNGAYSKNLSGCVGVQCDPTYSLGRPIGNMVDGVIKVKATASNAIIGGEAIQYVKVDNSGPVVALSGLGPNYITGLDEAELSFKVNDGVSKVSSGVAAGKTSVTLDGEEILAPGGAGCSPGPCVIEREYSFSGREIGVGEHTLVVEAEDQIGNTTTKEFQFVVMGPEGPAVDLGPGQLNLQSGNFLLSSNDVSEATTGSTFLMTRTHESIAPAALESPFGPNWQFSFGTWRKGRMMPDETFVITDSKGRQVVFEKVSNKYKPPAGYGDWSLVEGEWGRLILTAPNGSKTTFREQDGLAPDDLYLPTWLEGEDGFLMFLSWNYYLGGPKLGSVYPSDPEVPFCSPDSNPCRYLTLHYDGETTASGSGPEEWGDYLGRLSHVTLHAWDVGAEAPHSIVLVEYAYDAQGRLRAVWDPRISPPLKTTYGYDSDGRVTAVTPPGQQPWLMKYGVKPGQSHDDWLLSASRLPEDAEPNESGPPENTEAPHFNEAYPRPSVPFHVWDGEWEGAPATFSYQWERCDGEGKGCTPIPGKNDQALTPKKSELGSTFVAQVTAASASGSTTVSTAPSEPVGFKPSPAYTSAFGSEGSGDGQFKYASDVAVDPTDGTLWVADQGNNRIQHFSAAGQYLGQFASCADPGSVAVDSQGDLYVACSMIDKVQKLDDEGALLDNLTTSGTGNGQVRFPLDLALDGEDNLWIADNENARVQKLDPDGDFLLAFGVGGSGRPWGIDVAPDGNVWTAERNSHRVSVFEKDGDLLFRAGSWGSGDGQLKYPADVEVDQDGYAWVADAGNDRVQVFSPQGDYITQFGEEGSGAGQFDTEWWLRIALGEDGDAWILDEGNHRVQRWAAGRHSYAYTSAFGSEGSGDGQLKYASDVAVDPTDGTLWVADQGNNRIQHFSAAGQYLGQFASCADPGSVAVDFQGDLYVACSMIDKVQKFDDEGALLDNLTTSGTGNGQVRFPLDLALDGEDNLWIADNENARVQKLDPDGDFLLAFGVGGSGRPWGIDVAPDGNVWTAERNSHRVSVFEKDGDLLFRAGSWGSGDGQLKYPADVEVDQDGYAWVADAGNDRVQVFSPQGDYITQFGEEGSGAGQFDTEWWLRIALGEDGDAWILDEGNHRVQRWSLPAPEHAIPPVTDPGVTTWTAIYDVPLAGSTSPGKMTEDAVLKWGQGEVPSMAAAIFPPDQVPSGQPNSYKRATVYYLNESGQIVNTRAPGNRLSTEEHDALGNVTRTLTPENRARALEAGGGSQAVSEQLDTQFTYSEDGSKLLSVLGPKREVELGNGEVVEARPKTRYFYDEGAPKEGGPYNLVTKQTEAALIGGEEHDVRTKIFGFGGQSGLGWELGKPTSETTDPGGLNLTRTTLYDADSGNVVETRMPANPAGGDASSTRTIYYTGLKNEEAEECGGRPDWAGLVCQTRPVAQPETPGLPDLPVTTTTYNIYLQPLATSEVAGEAARTATIEYDDAGRPVNAAISSSSGKPLPDVQTLYDEETGLPTVQSTETEAVVSEYDSLGRLTSYTDADENTSTFAYDALGRITQSFDGKGTQSFSYDEITGDLAKIEDSAVGTFTAEHDAGGKILEMGYPNDLEARYDYDAGGAATSVEYVDTSECSEECTWFKDETSPSIHGEALSQESTLADTVYAYDDAGRLLRAEETPQGEGCTTRIYGYDANTNRTSSTTRGPAEGGGCAEAGGQTQTTAFDEADRLLGEGVAYDDFGNVIALPGGYAGGKPLSSTYYADDSAASLSQDGVTIEYMLDPVGREREAITLGGEAEFELVSHFSGDSDSPAWTEDGSGGWTRYVGGMGGLAAIQSSTEGIDLQISDLGGNIVATAPTVEAEGLDFLGEATEYGEPKVATPATYSWLGAAQRPVELDSGVVNMGARTYVPDIGRFLQVDPVAGGSANNYAYVHGDPVSESDPSGEYTPGGAPPWLSEYMESPPGMPPPPPPPSVELELLEEEIWSVFSGDGGMEILFGLDDLVDGVVGWVGPILKGLGQAAKYIGRGAGWVGSKLGGGAAKTYRTAAKFAIQAAKGAVRTAKSVANWVKQEFTTHIPELIRCGEEAFRTVMSHPGDWKARAAAGALACRDGWRGA